MVFALKTLSVSAAALVVATLSCSHAQTGSDQARETAGTLSAPGGARRLGADMTATYRALLTESSNAEVRNVILLIGDGMGDSEITIARNYALGASGFFKGIDALPVTGQYTHYSLDKTTRKPTYVTDSAASATAWATGVKTYNGAIGVDVDGAPHPTLIELAKQAGLATGNITTAEIEDATPAALVAHVTSRKCYGPKETSTLCPKNAREQGGAGSIVEQMLDIRPDVMMGGGAATFDQLATAGTWKGKTLTAQAKSRGFSIVRDQSELDAISAADAQRPVLGLFAPGNLPVRWKGPAATHHGNIDQPAVTCSVNDQRSKDIPTLASMTRKAIDLLKGNAKGFFLQVEGASIDKQDHAANPCGQIGETVDLDEAVQIALEFAKADGHTLVIVTADHAHSSQIIENGAEAPGLTQALNTHDGSVMTVSYGTSEREHQGHTGTQLRVAAYGPRAFSFAGLTDQTDMFYTIRDALRLK